MKIKWLISVLFLLNLFTSCKTGEAESQDEIVRNVVKKEYLALKLKADSAFLFCDENKLNTGFCFLVDMKIHSGKNRFFIWDFETDSVSASGLCAHGYGMNSTQKTPVFSNVEGSYCSSLGRYKTGARSYSNWGINIHYKLHGFDESNSNAFKRMVVLHSYQRVPAYEIYPHHIPLGYSQGCPVIDDVLMTTIDNLLQAQNKPTLLWIYY